MSNQICSGTADDGQVKVRMSKLKHGCDSKKRSAQEKRNQIEMKRLELVAISIFGVFSD